MSSRFRHLDYLDCLEFLGRKTQWNQWLLIYIKYEEIKNSA